MSIEKKYYTLSELFSHFERGKVHSQNSLPEGNSYFYVGAKKKNNGVMCRCGYDEGLMSRGNCLVFICNGEGSVGYCNYIDRDFFASGDLLLAYGDFLNPYVAMYMIPLLDLERPKYSFGRKYGSHVKTTRILLPAKDGAPDWRYMETFVKDQIIPQLPKKAQKVWLQKYNTKPRQDMKMKLNTDEWKMFNIYDLFEVQLSKGDIMADRVEDGEIPLISSGETNNGIIKYITKEGDGKAETFPANTITLDMFCHANYQDKEYFAVGHGRVNVLMPKFKLNRYIGLFICTLINREEYRFSYGRAVYSSVAEKMRIKLPVTSEGTPDWQFMEDYIKSLPYSKNLKPSDPNEMVDELIEVKKEMIKLRHQLQERNAQEVKIMGSNVTYIDNSTNYNIKK